MRKKRETIKNIKRVSCRFDMDVPEERRAWQILQSLYQQPPEGKKQDYTSIIAKAMIGHYDRKEEVHLTHEELLARVQESIHREMEEIKKRLANTSTYPIVYPYMPQMPGMTVQAEKQTPPDGELNEAALDFMDSFMG
ncbi:MAG: hypothetical protein J6C64_03430 [Lachnospiraceae bacterium]|nr:hypothetical protein [Lachnospiraceae bacterium]